MDGLEVERVNEENREYAILRMRCVVNEFLASEDAQREMSAKEFEMILRGVKELRS